MKVLDIFADKLELNMAEERTLDTWMGMLENNERAVNSITSSGGGGGVTALDAGSVEINWAEGIALKNPDTGAITVRLDPDGDAYFGSDTSDPAYTSFIVLSNAQIYNEETFGVGDILLGDNSSGKANLFWDASEGKLYFRSGTTVSVTIGDGGIEAEWGTIGGWIITDTTLHDTSDNIVLDSYNETIEIGSGLLLDGPDESIYVGSAEPRIVIDGGSKAVYSSNYASGESGFWIDGATGNAEFNDIVARGAFRSSVFSVGEIAATAGTQGVFYSAGTLYQDVDIDSRTIFIYVTNSDVNPTIPLFSSGDWLRIKSWNGSTMLDVWGIIMASPTNYSGYSRYLWKLVDYDTYAGETLYKGMVVADYGPSESGFITLSADGSVGASANITIAQHIAGEVTGVARYIDGTGYTVNDTLTLVQAQAGGDATVNVDSVDGAGAITGLSVVTGGTGYLVADEAGEEVLCLGGTGSGAYIFITTTTGPWADGFTPLMRLGNLNGSYGAGANDYYGMGIGDYSGGNFLTYNADGAGEFLFSAGGGSVTMDDTGLKLWDDAGASETRLRLIWDDSGTERIVGGMYSNYGGSGTPYMEIYASRYTGDPWSNAVMRLGAWDYIGNTDSYLTLNTNGNVVLSATDGSLSLVESDGVTVYYNMEVLGGLTVGDESGGEYIHISGQSGYSRDLRFMSDGDYRWIFRVNADTESGSDAGSDLEIIARADDGTYLNTPIKIWRADNIVKLGTNTDIYSTVWTNYTSSSTITGWSSFTESRIYYKRVGKLCFVKFRITGTSNSTTTQFTLPYNSNGFAMLNAIVAMDNGSAVQTGPYVSINTSGTAVLGIGIGYSASAWTASGDKRVYGEFFYEVA